MLHNRIRGAKQISTGCAPDVVFYPAHARRHCLLAQPRDVPDAYGLVEGGGGHQVLGGVELGTHDVMVMASQHTTGTGYALVRVYVVFNGTLDQGNAKMES